MLFFCFDTFIIQTVLPHFVLFFSYKLMRILWGGGLLLLLLFSSLIESWSKIDATWFQSIEIPETCCGRLCHFSKHLLPLPQMIFSVSLRSVMSHITFVQPNVKWKWHEILLISLFLLPKDSQCLRERQFCQPES